MCSMGSLKAALLSKHHWIMPCCVILQVLLCMKLPAFQIVHANKDACGASIAGKEADAMLYAKLLFTITLHTEARCACARAISLRCNCDVSESV